LLAVNHFQQKKKSFLSFLFDLIHLTTKKVIMDINTKSFNKIWFPRLPQFFELNVWKGCLWDVVVLAFVVVVVAVVVDVLVAAVSSSAISRALKKIDCSLLLYCAE